MIGQRAVKIILTQCLKILRYCIKLKNILIDHIFIRVPFSSHKILQNIL